MKYEKVSDWIVDFIKRFLFQSTFLLIFPLLFINGLESQHSEFINDHKYSLIISKISSLPKEQQKTIKAYINGEFTFQNKIVILIPLFFLLLEIYEIYRNKFDETQQMQQTQSVFPPPPILQPKAISEYVTEKNEEAQQIESYYRHQNQIIEKMKSVEEIKKSQFSQHSQGDLLNKLQFTVDSRQQDKILQSEYINNKLAVARHLGKIFEDDANSASPQFKAVRTQTIKDYSFVQNTNANKIDAQIQNKIYAILIEIGILQIIVGYLTGTQNRIILATILIVLQSCFQICIFYEWMIFISRPQMVTYLMLLYILFIIFMYIGMFMYQTLIQIGYCVLCVYCIKLFIRSYATQTIKSTCYASGVSLLILISIIILFQYY